MCGGLEAPAQMVTILYLIIRGLLPLPWTQPASASCIQVATSDCVPASVYLDMMPGQPGPGGLPPLCPRGLAQPQPGVAGQGHARPQPRPPGGGPALAAEAAADRPPVAGPDAVPPRHGRVQDSGTQVRGGQLTPCCTLLQSGAGLPRQLGRAPPGGHLAHQPRHPPGAHRAPPSPGAGTSQCPGW